MSAREKWTRRLPYSWAVIAVGAVVGIVGAVAPGRAEPPPRLPSDIDTLVPNGRVIYRAVRAGSFESLGITVIACRHRDPVPRRFMVEFFERSGRKVTTFGGHVAEVPAGEKLIFVTDSRYFKNRKVTDVRLGHLTGGPAVITSNAEIVRCQGKIRLDGGIGHPSRRGEIGLYREGETPPPRPEW